MILEGLLAQKYYVSQGSGRFNHDELEGLEISAYFMTTLLYLFLYLFLVVVASYTAYQCNKNNPPWLFVNLLVAIFFPGLYLIVHPNLALAHEGPKSYCNTP